MKTIFGSGWRLRGPRLSTIGAAALWLVWTLAVQPAAANGRFPLSNQIVFSPTDPKLIVLRTSYGILPSHDNGATWSYVCEDALGVGPSSLTDPSIGLTGKNSLLAGVPLGMNVSPDVGCNWSCAPGSLAGQSIVDLAVRPDSPSGAVAITGSDVLDADSGQELKDTRVFETTDDGATWKQLGVPLDPKVIVTTIDVARTDPERLYVSGTRGFGSQKTASLFVSNDHGQTWAEHTLPAGQFDASTEDSIYIGAVDPMNADRLYIRSSGLVTGGRSRLTEVRLAGDGGAPVLSTAHLFSVPSQSLGITGELLGLALSQDGSKIYVGTKESGLWIAQTSDLNHFQQRSLKDVQCLATRGSELWACSAAVYGFIAGVSTDDGKTFTSKLPLIGDLAGPIACKPSASGAACGQSANSSQCASYYDAFCASYSCGPPDASGPLDASGSGGTSHSGSTGGSSSSCDLAVVGGGEGAAGLGAALALAGVALRRRRRKP